MFIAPKRIPKVINVKDDFASLISVKDNGDLEFEIMYEINQTDIINKGISNISVTVYTTKKNEISIFENKEGKKADTKEVVDNILNMQGSYRGIVKINESKILTKTFSDATSKVNNQIISYVKSPQYKNSNNDISRLSSVYKTKIILKEVSKLEKDEGINRPVLQTNRNVLSDIDNKITVKQSIKNMILKNGIDPGDVVELKKDRISSSSNIRGTYTLPTRRLGHQWGNDVNSDIVKRTFNQMLPNSSTNITTTSEISSEKLVQVLQTVPTDKVQIPVSVLIESDKLSSINGVVSIVFVKFDVLNSSGVIVDTIERELDISFHLRLYNTPKIAPEVKFSRYETLSKGNLQIFQLDPIATKIRVYSKFISHTSSNVDDYILIGEYPLTKGLGYITLPISINRKDTTIFRVIPVSSDNITSFEYTNIIVNPSSNNKIKYRYVSLISKIVDNGISLEVRELPPDAISFRILRKNKTIFDRDYTTVGDDVILIDTTKDNQVYSVVDILAKEDNVYEYNVELIYKNGTKDICGYSLVEYKPLIENLVDTRISDLQTSYDPLNPDVTFALQSKLIDGGLDTLKMMLEKQNLISFFSDDILKERDKLQKLIAYQIYRVNLSTGQKENFGVITSNKFTDSEYRKINNVLPLKQGYRYRYEVNTLLRSSETLFENYEKTTIDPVTKKSYTFKPSKFFHPITLKKGNILDKETQTAHYSKDDMSFGNVGDLVVSEISFTQDNIEIIDVKAIRYDKYHSLIQWTLNGNSKLIENFIIILEENEMQIPIGKIHATDEKTQYQFIHSLTKNDIGSFTYKILPTYIDYSMGTEVKSNTLLVI